jgi:L-lactate dehydrogenase complex protein LldG
VTTKEQFLGRLRGSLAGARPVRHRPLLRVDEPPLVEPRWPEDPADVSGRWAAAFQDLGGRVVHTSEQDAPAAVFAALDGRGPVLVDERVTDRIARRDGSGPDGVASWLEWPGCGLEAAATAVSGVVEATAAVAATGSIVVDTTRNGRLVSLLPRLAVFVVRASTIVALPGDLLRGHVDRWPDGPPTNVVFVTGPSRSGDIEMILVIGVHGPAEVVAVLVEDG